MENRPADNPSLQGMEKDTQAGILQEEVEIHTDRMKFRVEAEFENMKDEARFYYDAGEGWKQIGSARSCISRWIILPAAGLDCFCMLQKGKSEAV